MPELKLSVVQLNNYIKNIFDNEELLLNVGVFGEVTNYKVSGGNAYFDIKDQEASLSCLEFGAKSSIKNGDMVLVSGRPNYHIKLGRFSFIVYKIEPYGQGELYLKFLELKQKLEKEGVFDERHKKQIPPLAHNIGVVASETGAVIHDIINVTKSKNPFANIYLYPTKVQGEGAKEEIVSAIKFLNSLDFIDVIIVARGGGSMEDLAPFNTEEVAMAVFESQKPIISGVGHETDFSLCDFASDLRAPTPSVAADLAVFDYYQEIDKLSGINEEIAYKTDLKQSEFKTKTKLAVKDAISAIEKKIAEQKNLLKLRGDAIYNLSRQIINNEDRSVCVLASVIEKTNPLAILKSGYSKTYVDGKVLNDKNSAKVGDTLETNLINGKIFSRVTKIGE